MRKQGLRESTRKAAERAKRKLKTRLSQGEKRTAMVATVYSVARHVRSPEAIMGLEEPAQEAIPRPRARNKRDLG